MRSVWISHPKEPKVLQNNSSFLGKNEVYIAFILKFYLVSYSFSGIIGSGYFHPCRKFSPEICDVIKKLVPTGRILWQWTKVHNAKNDENIHYL